MSYNSHETYRTNGRTVDPTSSDENNDFLLRFENYIDKQHKNQIHSFEQNTSKQLVSHYERMCNKQEIKCLQVQSEKGVECRRRNRSRRSLP